MSAAAWSAVRASAPRRLQRVRRQRLALGAHGHQRIAGLSHEGHGTGRRHRLDPVRGGGRGVTPAAAGHLSHRAAPGQLPHRRMVGLEDHPEHQRRRLLRRGAPGPSVGFPARLSTGGCETYLLTASYYGVDVARIEPKGHDRYLAVFRPTIVPCPHRAREVAPTNQEYSRMTLSWSPQTETLRGVGQDRQTGPCGGGPPETASYVATTDEPVRRASRGRPVGHLAGTSLTGVAVPRREWPNPHDRSVPLRGRTRSGGRRRRNTGRGDV